MEVSTPILHVDMDAFYASVEVIKDPALKGKPLIVGGLGGRGVVTSASYEARAYGVHSAMPIMRAKRLCPHAIYLPNDFESYSYYSKRIREVFHSFTPLVEPLSLDEAFLDISGSVRLFGAPEEIARKVKVAVAALGLPCTVGVAPNKFLAKLASDAAKPDGLLVVPADGVISFLHPLPVDALWGVGETTADKLRRLGLRTVGDLARMPRSTLERAIGEAAGRHLHHLANGRDERVVVAVEAAKQVGSEETFSRDLDDATEILREILRLSDRTAARLRAKSYCGRTVTLKVRWANFSTITRSKTLDHEVATGAEIYSVAKDLFRRLGTERPRVRLLGVSVGGLRSGPPRRQMNLEESLRERGGWDEATDAIDSIRARFGESSVGPAALLDVDGTPLNTEPPI